MAAGRMALSLQLHSVGSNSGQKTTVALSVICRICRACAAMPKRTRSHPANSITHRYTTTMIMAAAMLLARGDREGSSSRSRRTGMVHTLLFVTMWLFSLLVAACCPRHECHIDCEVLVIWSYTTSANVSPVMRAEKMAALVDIRGARTRHQVAKILCCAKSKSLFGVRWAPAGLQGQNGYGIVPENNSLFDVHGAPVAKRIWCCARSSSLFDVHGAPGAKEYCVVPEVIASMPKRYCTPSIVPENDRSSQLMSAWSSSTINWRLTGDPLAIETHAHQIHWSESRN